MEAFDGEKVLRVWQRIREGTEPAAEVPLRQLIGEEQTDGATFLLLSRRFRGHRARLLQAMARQEQSHAACLKGILALTGGMPPADKARPLELERTENLLRRCFARQQHRLAEYQSLQSDPGFGQVYAYLAAQEQDHCRLLLELLGSRTITSFQPPPM